MFTNFIQFVLARFISQCVWIHSGGDFYNFKNNAF